MYWSSNNIKTENDEFKEVSIKNRTCYYFDNIINIEEFDFYNTLLNEKSYESILIYNILIWNFEWCKTIVY